MNASQEMTLESHGFGQTIHSRSFDAKVLGSVMALCGSDSRLSLQYPWAIGGNLYVTNGHAAVRLNEWVPADHPCANAIIKPGTVNSTYYPLVKGGGAYGAIYRHKGCSDTARFPVSNVDLLIPTNPFDSTHEFHINYSTRELLGISTGPATLRNAIKNCLHVRPAPAWWRALSAWMVGLSEWPYRTTVHPLLLLASLETFRSRAVTVYFRGPSKVVVLVSATNDTAVIMPIAEVES